MLGLMAPAWTFLWRYIPFPHSRQPCRISIYYRQTMSAGNASTMSQDVIICQLVPLPQKELAASQFLVKILYLTEVCFVQQAAFFGFNAHPETCEHASFCSSVCKESCNNFNLSLQSTERLHQLSDLREQRLNGMAIQNTSEQKDLLTTGNCGSTHGSH